MEKVISIAIAGLLMIFPVAAQAAGTAEDVDYSQKVSTALPNFQKAIVDWGALATKQPSLTIDPKYKSWKAKFIASSNAVIKTAKILDGLKGTQGFTKSDPLLHAAMASYIKGTQKMISAVNKNSTKGMNDSGAAFASAGKNLLAWQTAYQADVAELNK